MGKLARALGKRGYQRESGARGGKKRRKDEDEMVSHVEKMSKANVDLSQSISMSK